MKPQPLPDSVSTLLSDLEPDDFAVGTSSSSGMCVTVDGDEYTFSAEDCEKLLASPNTVRRLFKAFGSPATAEVSVTNVELELEVKETLQELFVEDEDLGPNDP